MARQSKTSTWKCCDTILLVCFVLAAITAGVLAFVVGKPYWDELRHKETSCAISHLRLLDEVQCNKCYDFDSSSSSSSSSGSGSRSRSSEEYDDDDSSSSRSRSRSRSGSRSGSRSRSTEEYDDHDRDHYDNNDWWFDWEDVDFDPEAWWQAARDWIREHWGIDLPEDVEEDWDEDWDWGTHMEERGGRRWGGSGRRHRGGHRNSDWKDHWEHRHSKRSVEEEYCPSFTCMEVEVFYRDPRTDKSRFGMLYSTLKDKQDYPKCSLSTCDEDEDDNYRRQESFARKIWETMQQNRPMRCYVSCSDPKYAILEKEESAYPTVHCFMWPALISLICLIALLARRCYYSRCCNYRKPPSDVKKVDPEPCYPQSAPLYGEKAPLPPESPQVGNDVTSDGVNNEKDPALLDGPEKTGLWLVPPVEMNLPPYSETGRWATPPPTYRSQADLSEVPDKEQPQA